MKIEPYLTFYGRCEEALTFYQEKLGAEVVLKMRFDEAPQDVAQTAPEHAKKIMHASLKIGSSILMASDGDMSKPAAHAGFSISIQTEDVAAGEKAFNGLAEGGSIRMPWGPTFWALGFGLVTDKFGIPWMVNVERPRE
jgi:PhnB protein